MTPEERNLLTETARLTKENNEILKSIRRSSRIGAAFKFFYWIIIIGLSFGAYFFIQPYIDQLTKVYSGFQSDVGTIKSATNNVSGVLKNLGI